MRTRASLVLLVAAVLHAGCAPPKVPHRQFYPPEDTLSLDGDSPFLKAHMCDGSVYLLSSWSINEQDRLVSGTGKLLDYNREVREEGDFEFPIESVLLFESNVVETSGSVASMTVITGCSVLLTVYCLMNPKACFGSCPTFYVEAADRDRPLAEGFSSSVAPCLESVDVDALHGVAPGSTRLEILMTNEALETHVVRQVDVLAARRPADGQVMALVGGGFRQVLGIVRPSECTGPEGDCQPELLELDRAERWSSADASYLGAKEELLIEFPDAPAGELGVVISSRQSLMTTYLFYQALSYLGREAGTWMAALESGDDAMMRRFNAMVDALGGIEVFIETDSGEFLRVGELRESGPIATDTVLLELPPRDSEGVRLKLRLTKGLWRLDRVSLATLGDYVRPERLSPVAVLVDGHEVGSARESLLDASKTLTTYPGDRYTFVYELPGDFAKRDLFLESSGYYLEWMREEWLAEENLPRALTMFLNPEQALRDLAPEFSAVEADVEETFWKSRYVR